MPTNFDTIYDFALSKMHEYAFVQLDDEQVLRSLNIFRRSAQVDFARHCSYDLYDTDDQARIYRADLPDECIEILALGIVYHWMRNKIANSDVLRNNLSTKDFTLHSNQGILKEMGARHKELEAEYFGKILEYGYVHGRMPHDAAVVTQP